MRNNLIAPVVRPMLASDIPTVMRIQAECYPPAMLESEEVFRARLALTPATCWIWEPGLDNAAAYLFSYPTSTDVITPLGARFKLASAPDCLYLHDLAVAPAARGQRAANLLVTAALGHARAANLGWSALVSVQHSQAFWGSLGFAAAEVRHLPARENLDSYQVVGSLHAAVYMLQQLT
ncbi:GNAT family N-acetyltransferase [Collimonas fungivorans]|uniref:GCN5-like N-acetyltransferase n=1 Tax=Collimonas fungivorans (strain Ter331) TaxID=1005048 RepID=G0AGK6_COLFT|nr:GNAT family N-acetyltransferase [Collimonas fungivorans]AEK61619.1 GCN5-like N-acetyltransferase [Collimonas fungivorans Ter331]